MLLGVFLEYWVNIINVTKMLSMRKRPKMVIGRIVKFKSSSMERKWQTYKTSSIKHCAAILLHQKSNSHRIFTVRRNLVIF